jgi:hypothetical protein
VAGSPTVSDTLPERPSKVAVIDTAPGIRPVTTPLLSTTATVVFEEVQVADEVTSTVPPFPSNSVASSCKILPAGTLVAGVDTLRLVNGEELI